MHRLFRTPGPEGDNPADAWIRNSYQHRDDDDTEFVTEPSTVLSAAAMQSGDY